MQNNRVAVLMGGVSFERDVSLKSGQAIAAALREKGHDVVEVDLKEESIAPVLAVKPDVAFIALHGRFGEDGGVQSLLEEVGLPYVGSDRQASRAGMDKMASKCFFITHDVPTAPFRLITQAQRLEYMDAFIEEIGLPLVIKPLRQGSSIGISLAHTPDQAAAGLDRAFKYGHQAMIERYIKGREFTVGILDNTALPVIELKHKREFFDFDAKYADSETERILQPEISRQDYDRIQEAALNAHNALGCRHLSRVDVMQEFDGCIYVLEVNTIPGFTSKSLFPLAAREVGVDFNELCDRLVRLAMAAPAPLGI